MIKLSRQDGVAVYVNPAAIALVRPPLSHEMGTSVIIFVNGGIQVCAETVEEVVTLWNANS